MLLKSPVFFAILLTLDTCSATQKVMSERSRNPLDSDFEKLAIETLNEWHVPGLAVAVIDGDDTWSAVSCAVSLIMFGGSKYGFDPLDAHSHGILRKRSREKQY